MLYDVTLEQLQMLPLNSLTSLRNHSTSQQNKLRMSANESRSRLSKIEGTTTLDTPDRGRVTVCSPISSEIMAKASRGLTSPITGPVDVMMAALRGGESPIQNFNIDPVDLSSLSEIVDSFKLESAASESTLGSFEESVELREGIAVYELEGAKWKALDAAIDKVLGDRAQGTIEEPIINTDFISLSPEVEKAKEKVDEFINNTIIAPFEENREKYESLIRDINMLDSSVEGPSFDFDFGPPISRKGKFILSRDGIYYDSRGGGGIPEVEGIVLAASGWNLSQPPNLGGKGLIYTDKDLDGRTGSFIDFDYILDSEAENDTYLAFLAEDSVLKSLEEDRHSQAFSVSSQIDELLTSPDNSESSAIVKNYYGSLAAIVYSYDVKIEKRKKQLQLVAVFGQHKYVLTSDDGVALFKGIADGESFDPKIGPNVLVERMDVDKYRILSHIPVNNFSFLKNSGANLKLSVQKEIILTSEDLKDTTLPVKPVFYVGGEHTYPVMGPLEFSELSESLPVHAANPSVSSVVPFVKHITDQIVSDGLLASYTFTSPDAVHCSSTKNNVRNVAGASYGSLDAQLVGSSVNYVFPSGLSLPKLEGSYYNDEGAVTSRNGGSYVRLPNTNSNLNNIAYQVERKSSGLGGGFSFDFWTHVPSLVMTDVHRYRLVIANENSGGTPLNPIQRHVNAKRSKTISQGAEVFYKETDLSKTQGMLIGFRDRGGSSTPSGLEFCILPTVSQNHNKGKFGHSICIAESSLSETPTPADVTELGFCIPSGTTTTKGVAFTDASSSFVHFSVVFDYINDKLSVYADGYELSSTIMSTAFDITKSQTLAIPSFTQGKISEQYEASWESTVGKNGPVVTMEEGQVLGTSFTPWILGGGFSDNIWKTHEDHTGAPLPGGPPGFLGYNTNDTYYSKSSGVEGQHEPELDNRASSRPRSGLSGFLGSFKVYEKPLTPAEVLQNYTAQKGFFKEIAT